ncbi:MAG: HAD-IIA family hydrolase [Thermodesulfobacteriota bacterium]
MKLSDKFDHFLIDLDGVVYIGDKPISGSIETLLILKDLGKTLIFLTNDPRSSVNDYSDKLNQFGFPAKSQDIITSSMAIAYYIQSNHKDVKNRKAYVVGSDALKDEITKIGLELVAGEEAKSADFVIIGGHPGFHYEEIKISSLAIRNGAYFYATSRDPYIPTEEGLVPATGAVLASIEVASGQKAIIGGKPEKIIFEVAMTRKHLRPKERTGVIGDRLDSDIIGGKRAGIKTILVLSGSTKEADLYSGDLIPDYVINDLTGLLSEIDTAWNRKMRGKLT